MSKISDRNIETLKKIRDKTYLSLSEMDILNMHAMLPAILEERKDLIKEIHRLQCKKYKLEQEIDGKVKKTLLGRLFDQIR